MSKALPFALPAPVTREDWIRHWIDYHDLIKGAPSPDEMRKYMGVFFKLYEDHQQLHTRMYTGHEHEEQFIVPGRLS